MASATDGSAGAQFLRTLLQRDVLICLTDCRQRVKGKLYCIDGFRNMILSEACEEVWCATSQTWQIRRFSLVVVPGNSISRIFVSNASQSVDEVERGEEWSSS
jgi:small nuclear ribonucleoprotein (snRNP)-like protein